MPTEEKKGITVKVNAELHAEVKKYIESHGMTMAEFVSLALQDELHPKIQAKEEMGNMRTLAFQVSDDLFRQIKEYLQRNNMTQKEFIIGLIETELERDMAERENAEQLPVENEEDTEQKENTAVSDFEAVSEDVLNDAEEQDDEEFSDAAWDEHEKTEAFDEYEGENDLLEDMKAIYLSEKLRQSLQNSNENKYALEDAVNPMDYPYIKAVLMNGQINAFHLDNSPENIASFILHHQNDGEISLRTPDDVEIMIANRGYVLKALNADYLDHELNPALSELFLCDKLPEIKEADCAEAGAEDDEESEDEGENTGFSMEM